MVYIIHCFSLRIYFIILLSSLSSDSTFIKIKGLCGKLRIPKITTVTPFPHVLLCVCDLATSHQAVMSNNSPLESRLNPVTRLTNKICEVAFWVHKKPCRVHLGVLEHLFLRCCVWESSYLSVRNWSQCRGLSQRFKLMSPAEVLPDGQPSTASHT